jgi:hypothetical protein
MRMTTRAFAGLGLIGLMLASHFASLVHLVVVPHVTCLEHGDLVHAGNDTPAPETGEGTGLSTAPSVDDHDHCSAVAQHRAVSMSLTRVEPARPSTAVEAGHELLGCPSLAVLHVAPKASPPV